MSATWSRSGLLHRLARLAAIILMGAAGTAGAQEPPPPTFTFDKPPPVKLVEWKAATKAGLLVTSGNSQLTTFTFGGTASRKDPSNKLQLDFNAAYARSNILVANDANGNGQLDPGEISRTGSTTANQWNLRARYDRFFTTNNSFYAAGLAAADQVAGKDFFGGGQIGYARQLHASKRWEASAEAGYDLSYEMLSAPTSRNSLIQSARVFLGGKLWLTPDTMLLGAIETLTNLNPERLPWAAGYAQHPFKWVPEFHDTRVNGKLALQTKLWRNISFGFSFAVKYDQNPAPRPGVKDGSGTVIPFAPGYVPFVARTDTITEASLIITFL
jgi:hypothetical protein